MLFYPVRFKLYITIVSIQARTCIINRIGLWRISPPPPPPPPPPSRKLTNFRKFWSKRGLKTVFSSANGGGYVGNLGGFAPPPEKVNFRHCSRWYKLGMLLFVYYWNYNIFLRLATLQQNKYQKPNMSWRCNERASPCFPPLLFLSTNTLKHVHSSVTSLTWTLIHRILFPSYKSIFLGNTKYWKNFRRFVLLVFFR
jgi:hypothetical protein